MTMSIELQVRFPERRREALRPSFRLANDLHGTGVLRHLDRVQSFFAKLQRRPETLERVFKLVKQQKLSEPEATAVVKALSDGVLDARVDKILDEYAASSSGAEALVGKLLEHAADNPRGIRKLLPSGATKASDAAGNARRALTHERSEFERELVKRADAARSPKAPRPGGQKEKTGQNTGRVAGDDEGLSSTRKSTRVRRARREPVKPTAGEGPETRHAAQKAAAAKPEEVPADDKPVEAAPQAQSRRWGDGFSSVAAAVGQHKGLVAGTTALGAGGGFATGLLLAKRKQGRDDEFVADDANKFLVAGTAAGAGLGLAGGVALAVARTKKA